MSTGSDYSLSSWYEALFFFKATYKSYYEEEVVKLLDNVELYGMSVYGNGAIIKPTPFINVFACSPGNLLCVLDAIDCSNYMLEGCNKDAKSQRDAQSDCKD